MSPLRILALVASYARLELKAEASKFYLYYVWWVLEPILFVGVFYLVFKVILASPTEQFLLFLMCGKIPFFWFSKSVNEAAHSLRSNRALIAQIAVPKFVFPHAMVLGNAFKQVFVFPLLVVLSLLYGYKPDLGLLWLVPIMLVQLLLIQACALFSALLVSFVEDFRPLIQMATLFLMFGSGIFWDVNSIANPAVREAILLWNPLAFLVDSYRIVLMGGDTVNALHLAALALVCVAGLVGLHALYKRLDSVIVKNVV